ncbi:MAG: AAA family ATPase [Chloroflexia bacterium]|nr:AAA family ATPase [Chloroflexia bacterium]
MKIAIAGKGGVGKTTVAGTLARLYAAEGRPVLAIDADPSTNLGSAIGISPQQVMAIQPIAQMDDLIEERTGARPGSQAPFFKLNPRVDDLPETLSIEHEGVRLMVMGTVQRGGSGCVCPENIMLRSLVTHLLLHRQDVVILDMVAGIEHLGRATASSVDALIAIVEPGRRSIQMARRIRELAADIGIQRLYIVGNKVRTAQDEAFIVEQTGDLDLLGIIHHHDEILQADRQGRAIYDLGGEAVEEVRAIKEKLDSLLGGEE